MQATVVRRMTSDIMWAWRRIAQWQGMWRKRRRGGSHNSCFGGGSGNNGGCPPLYLKWGVGIGGQRQPWRQGSHWAATMQQHNKKGVGIGGRQPMARSLRLPSHIFLNVE
jgi:hypothetical protein